MTASVVDDPKQAAVTREVEILASIDEFLRVHSDWESHPLTPDVPTEFFRESIEYAIDVCDNGDVPAVCRDLVTAMGRLRLEWEDYVSGAKVGAMTKDGPRPSDSFWASVRGVINSRKGATRRTFNAPEPVFLLLEQKVSEKQIALIWSVDGKGPFTSAFGPDVVKIREEAKEPGKHTAEWVKEQTERLQSEVTKLVSRSLERTEEAEQDRPIRNRFVPDPATIEQLLREGQFPQVIAKVKGVTLAEVYAEAKRIGVDVAENDLISAPAVTNASAPQPKTPVATATSLDDRIRELYADGKGAAEIAKELKAEFPAINPQKAAAVIREAKKAVPENDPECDDEDV